MLLAAALTALAAPLAAQAVDDGTVGIRPAHEPTFLHLRAYPGETVTNAAIVSNHTASAVTLLDYPVDAHTSGTGTFAMDGQNDPRRTVGGWVQLKAPGRITIPAGTDRTLPFRLHIPAGTTPGDYAGALIIQKPTLIGKTADHSGTAVRLNVIQREGLRIYLHVDGTAVKTLTAGSLTWTDASGGTNFNLPIHNTGNTTLHPTAVLAITSQIGANQRIRFSTPEALLPGDHLTLHATLNRAALVQIGTATATLASEAGHRTITANYFDLPWTAIQTSAAILLLALLAVLALTRRRRHARRRTTPPVIRAARHSTQPTP